MNVFVIPAIIVLASCIGLVIALLGNGMSDRVAWITLSIPILAVAWAMLTRRM
jgi:hypothetical protein